MGGTRSLPLAARLPVYFACGLVTITAEMLVLTLGVRWSFWLLIPLPLLLRRPGGAAGSARRSRPPPPPPDRRHHPRRRLTSGDYVIFWGTKGQHFGQVRTLDVAFMKEAPAEMHADYPPLVPFYYAWTMLGGDGAFEWWGGALSAPLFLTLSVAAMYDYGKNAGIRVAALVCGRSRTDDLVAAVALAGVAWTKVEGGVVALVLALSCLTRSGPWLSRLIAGLKTGILSVIALLSWLAFSQLHGLTEVYTGLSDLSVAYVLPTLKTLWGELALRLWRRGSWRSW